MDAPGDSQLESAARDASQNASNHGLDQYNPPELSRSQTTLDGPSTQSTLNRGKSLRRRPTDVLEQQRASPPTPLRDPAPQPQLRARSSKMSLFSLFSKPKVEKLRGYAEAGLAAPQEPPRALSNSDASGPKQNIHVRMQNAESENGRTRPTTSRSHMSRATRLITKESAAATLPPLPTDRKPRAFEHTPLFQVWPQATRHGMFETTAAGSDPNPQKLKNRTPTGLYANGGASSTLNVPGNRGSVESGATVKAAIRHVRSSASISASSLPKKLFVLTTSGCLLQYADNGPSDRLPEKMLQLGKDSAAYASDLVPGKHHVLQISQAVDQQGFAVSASQSIFAKFSMRNPAARRITSNLLLIMPDAEEMAQWMSTIRREIEILGGKRARSESTSRPETSQPPQKIDLKKTPSQSHRYMIRRDPNGPSPVATPSLEAFQSPPILQVENDDQRPENPDDTAIDDSEQELQKTDHDLLVTRPRAPSDVPSITSTALSVDQQQLDKLRNSTRMSHTSTVATSVTAVSRTNSLTSSPCEQTEGTRDIALTRSPYRSLSSLSLGKGRPTAPTSLKDPPLPGVKLIQQQKPTMIDGSVDSPVVGFSSPLPEPIPSPKNNQSSLTQTPPDANGKHDSKTPLQLNSDGERPQSFLADLPDPTTWAGKSSPGLRVSMAPFPPLMETSLPEGISTLPPSPSSKTSPTSRPLRTGSNSFSLPLRVNPSLPSSPIRTSSDMREEGLLSPVPAVTTLTAKVDLTTRTTIDSSFIPPRKSSTSGSPPRGLPAKRSSSRLSLFPTTKPLPVMSIPVVPNGRTLIRSPSDTALSSLMHAQEQQNNNNTNLARLARPVSLQVRTDRAPFLSSIRSPTPMAVNPLRAVPTAPIRSLKPSRSVATMQTARPAPVAINTEPFNFSPGTNKPSDEESADQSTPLPERSHSPPILGSNPRSASRSRRSIRPRTSLTDIEFGMSLSALGPPSAPPPQAPLPDLPALPASQSPPPPPSWQARASRPTRASVFRGTAPIGLAISNQAAEHSTLRMDSLPTKGLGIRVMPLASATAVAE